MPIHPMQINVVLVGSQEQVDSFLMDVWGTEPEQIAQAMAAVAGRGYDVVQDEDEGHNELVVYINGVTVILITVVSPDVVSDEYRAAYVGGCVLTGPEHAHLSDQALLAEAEAEAERQGLIGPELHQQINPGMINIGTWHVQGR